VFRANLAVGVVAAVVLAAVLGGLVWAFGPSPDQDQGGSPGGRGSSAHGGTADFGPMPAATLDERLRPATGGSAPAAARPAAPPPVTVLTGTSARAGSGGGATAAPPVTTCSPNLLQTMLGLVTGLLGGRTSC
jgi:hypothetical protein